MCVSRQQLLVALETERYIGLFEHFRKKFYYKLLVKSLCKIMYTFEDNFQLRSFVTRRISAFLPLMTMEIPEKPVSRVFIKGRNSGIYLRLKDR